MADGYRLSLRPCRNPPISPRSARLSARRSVRAALQRSPFRPSTLAPLPCRTAGPPGARNGSPGVGSQSEPRNRPRDLWGATRLPKVAIGFVQHELHLPGSAARLTAPDVGGGDFEALAGQPRAQPARRARRVTVPRGEDLLRGELIAPEQENIDITVGAQGPADGDSMAWPPAIHQGKRAWANRVAIAAGAVHQKATAKAEGGRAPDD
jgi:hypothetical protein